jgi:predicted protein tyrosine phosphatase
MLDNNRAPVHVPDPGAPPVLAPRQLWHYAATQWRRVFGLNVTQIDDVLFVGGQFAAAQWPKLHACGVRAVLSLQAEREDSFHGPPPDRALRLPVEDYHPPTVDQLHAAVAFIRSAHTDRLPVLVHCHAGVGRASLTASAYLMTQGLGYIEAFSRIRRARPIVALNAAQLERLIEWERVLVDLKR